MHFITQSTHEHSLLYNLHTNTAGDMGNVQPILTLAKQGSFRYTFHRYYLVSARTVGRWINFDIVTDLLKALRNSGHAVPQQVTSVATARR
jgi:hypothetical protein